VEVGMHMSVEKVTEIKFYYIYTILKQVVRNNHRSVRILGG